MEAVVLFVIVSGSVLLLPIGTDPEVQTAASEPDAPSAGRTSG